MKNIIKYFAIPVISLLPLQAVGATELYVSPDAVAGSGNGTSEAPYTLEEAKSAVQGMTEAQSEDIYVYLMDGEYILDSTISFTAVDSGENGYNVIYKAYDGASPVLYGGKKINSSWTLVDAGKNIWKTTDALSIETRQLYVNGKKAVRARTEDGELPLVLTPTDAGYTVAVTDEILNYQNIEDVEFAYNYTFHSSRVGVASVTKDTITGTIIMDDAFAGIPEDYRKRDYITHIENAYELMDCEGEWYLDSAGYLYYIPRNGEEMGAANVIAPVLEEIINFNGSSNITLDGIGFKYTTWLYPTGNSFIGSQSGINPEAYSGSWQDTAMDYAIFARNVDGITISNCTFSELGGGGVHFGNGAKNNLVTGCEVYNCAGGGIYFERVNQSAPPKADIIENNTVSYSIVHDIGTEYNSCAGIFIGFARTMIVNNNEVYNTPYTGISVGWGWNDPGSHDKFKTDVVCRDNKVYRNLVHDVMLTLTDGGGIYNLGSQPGMEIQGNVVYNVGHTNGEYDEIAYYLDDGSRFITMTDNIGYGAWRPLYIKGKYNVSTGNYFDMENIRPETPDASHVIDNTVIADGEYPQDIIFAAGVTSSEKVKVFIKGKSVPDNVVIYGVFNKTGVTKSEDIFYINECIADADGVYTAEFRIDFIDTENFHVNTSETTFDSSISLSAGKLLPYEFYDIYDAQYVEGTDKQGDASKSLVSVFSARNTGKESICLAAGLYDGEDKLLKVTTKSFDSFSTDIFEVDVTQYTGEYKVKIMMWDSVSGMTPLTEFLSVTGSGE